jgi:hypothetical protein
MLITSAFTHILTAVTILSYTITCLRLITYRRGLGNYRLKISLIAWCLILFTGTTALDMILHPSHATVGNAGIGITLLVLAWRARGNVADMVRS